MRDLELLLTWSRKLQKRSMSQYVHRQIEHKLFLSKNGFKVFVFILFWHPSSEFHLVGDVTFVEPSRRFIREGALTKICRASDRKYTFFLFSDLVVYASKGYKLKLHRWVRVVRFHDWQVLILSSFLVELCRIDHYLMQNPVHRDHYLVTTTPDIWQSFPLNFRPLFWQLWPA
jgi:hypothetical protein